MSRTIQIVLRWLPALLVMLIIFLFSSRASTELPSFDWADRMVKKAGHIFGYALLAIAYWHGLSFKHERWWLAWGFAICYAISDEFHQSFAPGRFPSAADVLVFDNLGALMGLGLWNLYRAQRPDLVRPIVEEAKVRR